MKCYAIIKLEQCYLKYAYCDMLLEALVSRIVDRSQDSICLARGGEGCTQLRGRETACVASLTPQPAGATWSHRWERKSWKRKLLEVNGQGGEVKRKELNNNKYYYNYKGPKPCTCFIGLGLGWGWGWELGWAELRPSRLAVCDTCNTILILSKLLCLWPFSSGTPKSGYLNTVITQIRFRLSLFVSCLWWKGLLFPLSLALPCDAGIL